MEDEFPVRPAMKEDLIQIREIFNGYVRESFAAYPVQEVDLGYFEALHREGAFIPPYVVEYEGTVIGFGMIRPFLPFPTFRSSGQVSYFIHPSYTRRGLGGRLLEQLTRLAQAQDIHILLASISSRNEASLRFHAKHGFIECGRLKGIGEKFGKRFDVVWMQKEV
jgi:L-amino acid N-acyltransferase YncA